MIIGRYGIYEPFDADVELDKLYPTEQTNEEWFDTLSTEEKAKFLEMICYSAWGDKNSRFKDMADYTDWMEWLKQPHTTRSEE